MTAEEMTVVHVAEKEEVQAAYSSEVDTVAEKDKEELGKEDLSNGGTAKEDTDGDNDYVIVDGSDGVNGDPVESDLEKNDNGIGGADPAAANFEIKGPESESQEDRSCIGIVDHDKEPVELCHVESPVVEQKPGDRAPVSAINVEDDVSETSRGHQNGVSEPTEAVSESNGDASANKIAKRTISEAATDSAAEPSDKVSSVPVSDSNEVSLATDSVEDKGVEVSVSKEKDDSEITVAEDGDCIGAGLTNNSAENTIPESDSVSGHEQNGVSELHASDDSVAPDVEGVATNTDDAGAKVAVPEAAVVSKTEQDDGIPISVSDSKVGCCLPDNVEDAKQNDNLAEADCNRALTDSEGGDKANDSERNWAKQNGFSTVHPDVVSENEPVTHEENEVPVEDGFKPNSEVGFCSEANTGLEKETVNRSISDECGEALRDDQDSISETAVVKDSQGQSSETEPSSVTTPENVTVESSDTLTVQTTEDSDTTAETVGDKKLECIREVLVSETSEGKAKEDNSTEKVVKKDDAEKASSIGIQFGSVGGENEGVVNDLEKVENSSVGENKTSKEVEGGVDDEVESERKKPFYFLIRVPRYDDEDLKEKIRLAQIRVDEKTQSRDAIRIEMHKMRAICKEYGDNFDAAISQERVARDLLRSKRQEIESIQSAINIEDIAGRIRNMEHSIQHETLPLKEEKQLIREIKQLKQLREQLSSNMARQDEVQQDEKDQTEKPLKALKKEADQLRDNLQKAEAVTKAAKKKYFDETEKLNHLLSQFKAADDIRQEAYAQLQILKKQSYEKNKCFWLYKDDSKLANDLALKGDKEALQNLCVNQVERVMEMWNNNDEFRKEYVRFNIRSTLRRLKTLDGRALGPNEEPPAIPERVAKNRSISNSSPTSEEQTREKVVLPIAEKANRKPVAKDQRSKSEKPKSVPLTCDSTTASSRGEIEEARKEKAKRTEEQEELARRAEELRKEEEIRKEEEAAKLKEQRRLEEIAKAKEALERKKRIAEKAQARAVFRAQKEAEQKEKEREKRTRKKERRKVATAGVGDASVTDESEHITTSDTPAEVPIESENKETHVMVTKRPQKPSQFTKQTKPKSIPPPLRNRGKRRMQPWMWVLIILVIIVLLFVGNNFFQIWATKV